jgi:hypothetical protein
MESIRFLLLRICFRNRGRIYKSPVGNSSESSLKDSQEGSVSLALAKVMGEKKLGERKRKRKRSWL